jgi:hypothetical protein
MKRLLACAFLLLPSYAVAEGAVALSDTSDVAHQGVSFSIRVNYATTQEAEQAALEHCRHIAPGTAHSHATCEIVIRLHRQCAAAAVDPKDGTPGFGLAVNQDLETAKATALAMCKSTAGSSRAEFCVVMGGRCDTTDTPIPAAQTNNPI